MIHEKAKLLIHLNEIVLNVLPKELRSKCRVANYRDFILVLEVINASRKIRLRFELPFLLKILKNSILPSLSSIHVIINPTIFHSENIYSNTYYSLSKRAERTHILNDTDKDSEILIKDKNNLEIRLMKLNSLINGKTK